MATLTDRLVGYLMILLAAGIFLYYTLWVIILPFLEQGHFLHNYFLPQVYAIAFPVGAGLILVSIIGVFVSVVLMKDHARKKQKLKST